MNNDNTKGGECSICGKWKGGDFGMNGEGVQSKHTCIVLVKIHPPSISEGGYSRVMVSNAEKTFIQIFFVSSEKEREQLNKILSGESKGYFWAEVGDSDNLLLVRPALYQNW